MDPLGTGEAHEHLTSQDEPEASGSGSAGGPGAENVETKAQNVETEPPVTEIPHEDIEDVVNNFAASISDYYGPASLPHSEGSQDGSVSPEKELDARHNEAITVAAFMKRGAKQAAGSGGNYQAFKYDLGGGHTAAVMGLTHIIGDTQSETGTEISELATHPGTEGAGKTMIEKAANESINADGELTVRSFPSSESFYSGVGFKRTAQNKDRMSEDEPIHMHLNPTESDKWSKAEDGTLRLKGLKPDNYVVLPKVGGTKRVLEETSSDEDESPAHKRPHV